MSLLVKSFLSDQNQDRRHLSYLRTPLVSQMKLGPGLSPNAFRGIALPLFCVYTNRDYANT